MLRAACRTLLILAALALPALAQTVGPAGPIDPANAVRLERLAAERLAAGDLPAAEAVLREHLALDPDNPILLYNLGVARALRHDPDDAASIVARAVELGFDDIRRLRRDPQLAEARRRPALRAVLDDWPAVLDRQRDANLARTRALFRAPPREVRVEPLRVVVLSAYDEAATTAAIAQLSGVAEWARDTFLPDLFAEHDLGPHPWVVVALPARADFARWAAAIGDAGASGASGVSGAPGALHSVGGGYFHDQKRLVSQDLGSSLRHEFLHVLHWRDCTRRGQIHPIWVMEGLCSLVEDVDRGPDGRLIPTPSWRTNIARRLERSNRLPSLADLGAMPRERFLGVRPLANYAHARAFFLFLHDRGVLGAWYARFTDLAAARADNPALDACEHALGRPVHEIDAEFRAWVRALPDVPEQVAPGAASLGVEVEAGEGDGPVIVRIAASNAADAGLRAGDTILSLAGRSTADIPELVRVLSDFKPGDSVRVSFRRGGAERQTTLILIAR